MSEQHRSLPSSREWSGLGASIEREMYAGKQSRVFVGVVNGDRVAIKLTDERLADRAVLAEKMLLVERLAEDLDAVVAPMRTEGQLVHPVGGWLATATPLVSGRQPDLTDAADVRVLGRTLAALHRRLAQLPAPELPPVAALARTSEADRDGWQLLHGDFSNQNVILTVDGPRVFDFDDCGYGPALFDVAQSLYMVLFDAATGGESSRYDAFRPRFLEAYAEAAATSVDESVIDTMINDRIDVLGIWLDHLASAPIGIRTSSPEWLGTLRSFVSSYRS